MGDFSLVTIEVHTTRYEDPVGPAIAELVGADSWEFSIEESGMVWRIEIEECRMGSVALGIIPREIGRVFVMHGVDLPWEARQSGKWGQEGFGWFHDPGRRDWCGEITEDGQPFVTESELLELVHEHDPDTVVAELMARVGRIR